VSGKGSKDFENLYKRSAAHIGPLRRSQEAAMNPFGRVLKLDLVGEDVGNRMASWRRSACRWIDEVLKVKAGF